MTYILIGKNNKQQECQLSLKMANRHGVISGATGTGKTATLQVLAESFSKAGIPVFTADVKGDLSGLSQAGKANDKITERINKLALTTYQAESCPSQFWDLHAKNGLAVRTTISEFGPILLSRLMKLNSTQQGVLQIAFKYADDHDLLLIDLKDLRALLTHLTKESEEVKINYGNIATASVGTIQRSLLELEAAGAESFFAEPGLELKDLLQVDLSGKGIINILDATTLVQDPTLYSTFLLWLLSELFEQLPEVGDLEQPKLVFFFDEAHLLFNDISKALLDKIEMLVRLIRSKGVGVYFISQSPLDIPETVLAQLGNRIQHAIRTFTPKDQKVLRAVASSLRSNPDFDTEATIPQLAIGEALISILDLNGSPCQVERVLICPPSSRMGAISLEERTNVINRSPLKNKYEKIIDQVSAYEKLQSKTDSEELKDKDEVKEPKSPKSTRQSAGEAFFKSVLRSIGSHVGRILVRGILGSFKR